MSAPGDRGRHRRCQVAESSVCQRAVRPPGGQETSAWVLVAPRDIILGVWLYGEHVEGGPLKIAAGALGSAAMVVGVVFLGRTAPSFAADKPVARPRPKEPRSATGLMRHVRRRRSTSRRPRAEGPS